MCLVRLDLLRCLGVVLASAPPLVAQQRALPDDAARAIVIAAERSVDSSTARRYAAAVGLTRGREGLLRHAEILRLGGRLATADSAYTFLLGPDSQPRDGIARYAAIGRAQVLIARGVLRDAGAWAQQARLSARSAGDVVSEAEANLLLAYVLDRTVSGEAAESLYIQSSDILPSGADRQWARLHCARLGPPLQPGELEEREEALAGAARARRAGDVRTEARCLIDYAQGWYGKRTDSTLAATDRSIALLRRLDDRTGLLAEAWYFRGTAQVGSRDYGGARQSLLNGLDAARESGYEVRTGAILLQLASLSLRFRALGEGRRFATRAESVVVAQGNVRTRATLWSVQGDLARAGGDTAAARIAYRAALEASAPFGGYARVAPHRGLAALARDAGDWAAADAALSAARASAGTQGLAGWARRLDYDAAVLALERGDPDGAERAFRRFITGLAPEDRITAFAARMRLAELAARRGDVQRGASEASAAMDDLDAWRATLDDADLRVRVFELGELDLSPGLGLPYIVAALARAGNAAEAHNLAERRRGRDLLDRLLRVGVWGGAATPTAREAGGVMDAKSIVAALPPGVAVLEFVIGAPREPATALIATRAGVSSTELPELGRLTAAARRFAALLAAGDHPRRLDPALTRELLGPTLDGIPSSITRLIIVPEGPLHAVPFESLRRGDALLGDKVEVIIAPSATVALRLAARTPSAAPRGVLALGNPSPPSAGASESTRLLAAAAERAGGLAPLPAASGEARTAGRHSPTATVRIGRDASEAWFRTAPLNDYRVVHLAVHAIVSEADDVGAGLVLSPGSGQDGFVTSADLAQLKLDAELVLLSGCRTAGGAIVGSEGVQGLTAPLLAAGARAILATRWQVPDAAAARFVAGFYDELSREGDAATALQRARVAAERSGMTPSVWTAFTLVGSASPRVRL